MSKILGIDLGTTFSCVSVVEGGDSTVVPNSEGARTTPSVVSFDKEGKLVGSAARRQAAANPAHTIFAAKRLMGRKFDTAEVKRMTELYPFELVSAANGDAHIKVNGSTFSPQEISASVLEELRRYASDFLAEDVNKAVITVPAYFNDAQRQATRDAGRLAGLEVLRIINEPTAAALAHGIGTSSTGKVVVYDLGGGTFDVSVLDVSEGVFQVKATHGDSFLGGEDFDIRIVEMLLQHCREELDFDVDADPIALQRMKEAAEIAKIELSGQEETEIRLPFIHADDTGPKHLNLLLTRTQFEGSVTDIVERTVEHCAAVLKDAKLAPGDIDEILLVGGMTRMPLVRARVASFFGKEPSKQVNPDEAVAIGAAIQAGIISGEVDDVLLLDVIPLSLGIETRGGVFTRLIERNHPIPTSRSEVFTTAEDYQSIVQVHVLQGERPLARDNQSLARFDLVDMPPARRGVPKVEVAFDVDVNGILSVRATDLATGRSQDIRVRPSSGLSERQIRTMLEEAEEHRSQDHRRKDLVDLKGRAESLLYTTERSVAEFSSYLTAEEVGQIESGIKRCRLAVEGTNVSEIQESILELERVSARISEVLYRDLA